MQKHTKPLVLLVEVETSIRRGLEDVFTYHGYDVVAFRDGEGALAHSESHAFDIAILDVMLPGLDGFELCGRLRETRPSVPILMLTAKGSEDDIVTGFRSGADDYVTKPFSIRELLMRVEALLRRVGAVDATPEKILFGPWTVEPASLRASANGDVRELTPRELELVVLFVREKGRVVSRRMLLKEVKEDVARRRDRNQDRRYAHREAEKEARSRPEAPHHDPRRRLSFRRLK